MTTRYAIQRSDHRYLTLVEHEGHDLYIWLGLADPVTTWPTLTAALCAAWGWEQTPCAKVEGWEVVMVGGAGTGEERTVQYVPVQVQEGEQHG